MQLLKAQLRKHDHVYILSLICFMDIYTIILYVQAGCNTQHSYASQTYLMQKTLPTQNRTTFHIINPLNQAEEFQNKHM